tara:strand:+ start:20 stop:520 length:501 start_codon:yes stop_codon:yes gene_type:complete
MNEEEKKRLVDALRITELDISEAQDGNKRTIVGASVDIGDGNSISLNAGEIKNRMKQERNDAYITENVKDKFYGANLNLGNLNLDYKQQSNKGDWAVDAKNFTGSGDWKSPIQRRFGINYNLPVNDNFIANFNASHGDVGLGKNMMEGMNPNKDENQFLINLLLRR